MDCIRCTIAIILVGLISFGISYQTVTIAHFYNNQAEIEDEFCVNKDRPELNCHAQCHLKKQLENTTDENANSDNELNLRSILVFQSFEEIEGIQIAVFPKMVTNSIPYYQMISNKSCHPLLDPPEVS